MGEAPTPPPVDDSPELTSPRRFAQGTGLVLQTFGGLLFLSTCLICFTAFEWDPIQGRSVQTAEPISRLESIVHDPARFGFLLMVVTSSVGGLALMVFGLGLQSEKRRAGWAALIANVLQLFLLLSATVLMWTGSASILACLWSALLTVITAILLLFTIAALRQFIAHPPPDTLHTVPHDFDPKRDL